MSTLSVVSRQLSVVLGTLIEVVIDPEMDQSGYRVMVYDYRQVVMNMSPIRSVGG